MRLKAIIALLGGVFAVPQDVSTKETPPIISDNDFESYYDALQANTGYGGKVFLGPNLVPNSSWSYTGEFQIGLTRNRPWGSLPTVSGKLYAIFQRKSKIQQTVSGFKIGYSYVVSWFEVARPHSSYNDLGEFDLVLK